MSEAATLDVGGSNPNPNPNHASRPSAPRPRRPCGAAPRLRVRLTACRRRSVHGMRIQCAHAHALHVRDGQRCSAARLSRPSALFREQAMQRELDYLELSHQLRGRLTAQRLALQRSDKLAKVVQQRLDALKLTGARYAPGFT